MTINILATNMWLFFLGKGIAHSKKSSYLCNALHFKTGDRVANKRRWHFLCHRVNYNSSVPCGTLMRPLPVLGVEQWGAELFSSPVINKYIVSFQSSTK